MAPSRVFISLGSNLGFPEENLKTALTKLSVLNSTSFFKKSKLYKTSPVSPVLQEPYLNAVCSFYTSLDPEELFNHLEIIEKEIGKLPKPKTDPRVIDLDLLFYGARSLNTQKLQIPHPRWEERLFVLAPLAELAPFLWVPEGGKLVRKNIRDMVRWFPYSNQKVELFK